MFRSAFAALGLASALAGRMVAASDAGSLARGTMRREPLAQAPRRYGPAGVCFTPNGNREVVRRQRQIAWGQLRGENGLVR